MEITDRADLGADLFASTTDGTGKPYWGYELLTYVQPGDIVLHSYNTLACEPGIVGWSERPARMRMRCISLVRGVDWAVPYLRLVRIVRQRTSVPREPLVFRRCQALSSA
jgi:hypothetical protein